MHRRWRFLTWLPVSAALSLIGTPTYALRTAPAAIRQPADEQCWASVARSESDSRAQWIDERPDDVAMTVLSALELALACGAADTEQTRLVLRVLKTTLIDVGDFIRPTESQINAIHTWYSQLVENPLTGGVPAGLVTKYQSFSAAHPQKQDDSLSKALPPQPPDPEIVTNQKTDNLADTSSPSLHDREDVNKLKRGRNLQIGGASLLVLGAGSIAAGVVTLSRIGDQSTALAEMCTPACTDAANSAPLIKRGELYEALTPALLTIGTALTVAGGVLVGVGTKRRNKRQFTALTPIVTPRFVGANWTFKF